MKHYDKSYHKGVVRYGLLSPKNPPQKQNKKKNSSSWAKTIPVGGSSNHRIPGEFSDWKAFLRELSQHEARG